MKRLCLNASGGQTEANLVSHCKAGPQHTMTKLYFCAQSHQFHFGCQRTGYMNKIFQNWPQSLSVFFLFVKRGTTACLWTPLKYCFDIELSWRHTLVIIHLCRNRQWAWSVTYTYCLLRHWHFIFFYTINLHLSQTEDFLLNNRIDNDTFQHNWIIKLSAPALFPSLSPCQEWLAVEILACKPVYYWAGFCKSAKGKRREKRVTLCVPPVPIHSFSYTASCHC